MENMVATGNTLSDSQRATFRLWLQREFTERCKRNARYSLRAFAKHLKLDPSSLSQILSGKRRLSKQATLSICQQLSAGAKELSAFGLAPSASKKEAAYLQVRLDVFAVISDWYHYAILELTFVKGFDSSPRWIAKKLSITVDEAKVALERLQRLQLLVKENGRLIKVQKAITNGLPVNVSAAHRELQRQLVGKALLAIDECDPKTKDITSMTMAIDLSNLDQARKLIHQFRRELCALLEDGEPTEVYNLGIQLYPLSKTQESL